MNPWVLEMTTIVGIFDLVSEYKMMQGGDMGNFNISRQKSLEYCPMNGSYLPMAVSVVRVQNQI